MDVVTFLLVGIFVGFVLSKTQKPNKIIIFLAGIGTGMVVLYISAAMAVNGSLYALQHSYYFKYSDFMKPYREMGLLTFFLDVDSYDSLRQQKMIQQKVYLVLCM